ncbi:MAG: C4-dicarboxylate ABC transporter substrate-binding protein [bacterium]|nr:C4-dicarboxylate ABC transporter substrate-binding protein [bacterium]
MKRVGFILTAVLLAIVLLAAIPLEAVTIKIGTVAPLRSPWVKELKRLNTEWVKITGGKVKIKIFPGGIAGSEDDMVRKMRIGTLGGAVFTNRGITHIYPDSYVLSIPFSLESEEELDFVLGKLSPTFEKGLEDKGFKMITWAKAGWVNFFSKRKVVYPADLKKHKISFATGAPEMEQAWKKSGYHIIPNDLKDMMMALQSGMVDSFYLPPLMAASGQYFALAPHMCSQKIAPVVGGVVLSQKIWRRVPKEYRAKMMTVARKIAYDLYVKTVKLEEDAITEMKNNELVIHEVPEDAVLQWRETSDKGMGALVGKAFSETIYNSFKQYVKEYRDTKGK